MNPLDKCPWCQRRPRHREEMHTVHIGDDDPGGKTPGKHKVCSECAGFEYNPTPGPMHSSEAAMTDYCPICRRGAPRNTIRRKLRFTKEEHDSLNLPECQGWGPSGACRMMCHACYDKYLPTVQARIAQPFDERQWNAPQEADDYGTYHTVDDGLTPRDRYAKYVSTIGGVAVM